MGGGPHGLREAFAVVAVAARGDDDIVFGADAAGFGRAPEFGKDMHGAGEGKARGRGVFLAVVDGDDLKTDFMGQLARGKGDVAAYAKDHHALMHQGFHIDVLSVEVDAGGGVGADLFEHGLRKRGRVRMEGAAG